MVMDPCLLTISSSPVRPQPQLFTELPLEEINELAKLEGADVNKAKVILADEATGNLDSVTSIEIMTLLRNLNDEGRTIIMVTHEPDIAMWAKRQLVMRDGVLFKEIVNEVRTTPQSALAAKEDKAFVDDEVANATLAALPKMASADPGVVSGAVSGEKKSDNSSKKK